MALLKKFLNKSETESLFPKQTRVQPAQSDGADTMVPVGELVGALLDNEDFMAQLYKNVTEKLLIILYEKYDFSPTDKYLEEVSKRKKYIGQLDNYLQERRNINHKVENELQMFLQETTTNLTKALDTFTVSIQERIKQAETMHGIDSIKESLLSAVNSGEATQ